MSQCACGVKPNLVGSLYFLTSTLSAESFPYGTESSILFGIVYINSESRASASASFPSISFILSAAAFISAIAGEESFPLLFITAISALAAFFFALSASPSLISERLVSARLDISVKSRDEPLILSFFATKSRFSVTNFKSSIYVLRILPILDYYTINYTPFQGNRGLNYLIWDVLL